MIRTALLAASLVLGGLATTHASTPAVDRHDTVSPMPADGAILARNGADDGKGHDRNDDKGGHKGGRDDGPSHA